MTSHGSFLLRNRLLKWLEKGSYRQEMELEDVIFMSDQTFFAEYDYLFTCGTNLLFFLIPEYMTMKDPKTRLMKKEEISQEMESYFGDDTLGELAMHLGLVVDNDEEDMNGCFAANLCVIYESIRIKERAMTIVRDLVFRTFDFFKVYCSLIAPIAPIAAVGNSLDTGTNYKSRLQEYMQKTLGYLPRYWVASISGPDHARVFTMNVLDLSGHILGYGTASSKKQAEQEAAKFAMIHFFKILSNE
jgi:dsRNA-specific ribonuclease